MVCSGSMTCSSSINLETINLNLGSEDYVVYTTDLSPEYVDFNRSEYAYWNQAKRDGLTR